MLKILTILLMLCLFSCSTMSISSGRQKVIIKQQKSACDIHRKEIDPNCKIEGKMHYQSE